MTDDQSSRTIVSGDPSRTIVTSSPGDTQSTGASGRMTGVRTNVDTLVRKSSGKVPQSGDEGLASLLASRADLKLHDVAQDYEIKQGFAEGGQGSIFSAVDRRLKRTVAVKSLKKEFVGDADLVEGFLTEAGVTAQLDHPSVVPLYSLCSDGDEGLHIAMKMVNGVTLREYLENVTDLYRAQGVKGFDEGGALLSRLEYFKKVCEAISYAHSRQILHRDLKPENIMIGGFGEVYVMDWGLAVDFKHIEEAPADSFYEGSPGYMAPEVVSGERPHVQADIFALGSILYDIVTLRRAYAGKTPDEVLDLTKAGKTRPVEHGVPSVKIQGDIRAIVLKAMQLDPNDRYESVDALREDVRRFMVGEEVAARPDSPLRAASRWVARHRQQSLVLFLSVLLACAGLSISVLISKYRSEQVARRRQVVLANLQSSVDAQAHWMDSHILRLEGALQRYADMAQFLMESGGVTAGSTPFPHCSELVDLESAPPGVAYSSLYGENVSLDFSTYVQAPDTVVDTALLSHLGPLDVGLFQAIVESDPATTFDPARLEQYRSQALEKGFAMRYIYLGLENGTLFCFPGKSKFPEGYDPRARPWYQEAMGADGIIWTKPYYDAWGQGIVFSATVPVRNKDGDPLGVASCDVTLRHILERLMGSREHSQFKGGHRFVLNQDGKILLDSSLTHMRDAEAEKVFGELQLKSYDTHDVSEFLDGQHGGQIQVPTDAGTVIIACAPIASVGWYFVEELPLYSIDLEGAEVE